METKYCTYCETTKPISEFWKRNGVGDGYQPFCKSCAKFEKKFHRDRAGFEGYEHRARLQSAYYRRNKIEINARERERRHAIKDKKAA